MILFLLAQALQLSPLPREMEPALNSYVQCLEARIDNDKFMQKLKEGPKLLQTARSACAPMRAEAVERANQSLANLPAFSDQEKRASFVSERFGFLDELMLEVFSGDWNSDKWNK